MSSRPIIGIATQTQAAIPGELPRVWIMSQKYVQVLSSLGAVPWLVPLLPAEPDTLRAIYDRLDGIFLTGGVDVDPSLYGEDKHPKCGHTDRDRDAVEMMFVQLGVGRPQTDPGRLPWVPGAQRRLRRDALPGHRQPIRSRDSARLLPDRSRHSDARLPGSRSFRRSSHPARPVSWGRAGSRQLDAPPRDQVPGPEPGPVGLGAGRPDRGHRSAPTVITLSPSNGIRKN